jgi:hypothetical protein
VDHLGQLPERRVAETRAPDQRLEGAVLSLVPELGADRVERDRVWRELLGRGEEELGLRVDEAPDEPGRRDAVE